MFRKKQKMPMEVLFNLVCCALLIALQVVLSRFLSIQMWNMKIGFSFIPVIIAARLFGPLSAAVVYGIGDLIGSFLFPTGAYFPGFTLSAVISGLIFGLFLYKKSTVVRVVCSSFLNQLICSFLLNTFWISYISNSSYTALLAVRLPQSAGMCVVQIVLMLAVIEPVCKAVLNSAMPRIASRSGRK